MAEDPILSKWRNPKAILLAAVVCALGLTKVAESADSEATVIPRIKIAPTIDGNLTDPVWSKALTLKDFTRPKSTKAPGKQVTARICFDDRALYIAFTCQEPNPAKIRAQQTDGDQVWKDDCVEIWIRTTDDRYEFDQFIINSKNKHQILRRRKIPKPWKPFWKSATKVGAAEWCVEASIPFKALDMTRVKPGYMLQMKLGREDRTTGRNQLSTWPPGSPYAGTEGFKPVYFETTNLLQNADFLQRKGNVAARWSFKKGDEDKFVSATDGEKKIIRVSAPGRYCSISQGLRLKPNSLYRLEAKVRGKAGMYLRARTKPKPKGPSKPHTVWAKPSETWVLRKVNFVTGPDGSALIILGTTEGTGDGRVDIADLRVVRDVSSPATGPAIPVMADAPLTAKKLRVTDCRAVRGFIGTPIDGSLASRGWNGRVWEYKQRGAAVGVGYHYLGNDGLHITLPDKTGFNAIVVRGGVRAKVYRDCPSYQSPKGGTLVTEFPGRTASSRFFSKELVATDKVSFFDVGDGYIANLSFYRVDAAGVLKATDRLRAGGALKEAVPFLKERFRNENRTTYTLEKTGKGTAISAVPGKTFHLVSKPFEKQTPLAAIGLDMKVACTAEAVPFTASVQDPLNPRGELFGADFVMNKPGRLRLVLDFPDQVVPAGKSLWVSLSFAFPSQLSGPEGNAPVVELFTVPRDKAIPEALAYRKLLLKGYFDALSEARPWNGWYSDERIEQSLKTHLGPQLRELRMTLDQCVALGPKDPWVKEFYEWIWRKYRPWREKNKRGVHLNASHARITPVEGAPEWAVVARQAWLEARKVPTWWLDNRLVPTGEMGGIVGDDTDMYQNYAGFVMLESGGLAARLRDACARLAELAEKQNLTKGLNRHTTDPLHAYEEGVNHEALMAWWNYGDPVYMERCIVAAHSTEALTVMTKRGHRHFKSQMCGAIDLKINRKTDNDGHAHPLMWHPAFEVAWYNANPKVLKMLREWADGWLEHMEPGKYATSIEVATGKVTATTDRPLYGGYGALGSAFQFMYWVTGEDKYLGPFMDEFKAGRARTSPGNILTELIHRHGLKNIGPKLKELATGRRAADAVVNGNKGPLINALKVDIAELQNYFMMYTSIEPFTDRVFLRALDNASITYTGGYATRNKYCHLYAASYEGFGTDYAALVLRANPDRFKVLLYNFDKRERAGMIRLWTLDHGLYKLTMGPDANNDDKADAASREDKLEIRRGTRVPVKLPPGKVMVLELTQEKAMEDIRTRADLALSPLEVRVEGGAVVGVAHNIGSKPVDSVEVALIDAAGKILARKKLGKLEAPLDLVPRKVSFRLEGVPANTKGCTVALDPDSKIPEIYEGNNRLPLSAK